MTFEFKPAVRANVPLLIGLAGGTGSGKTYSALRLARGLAGGQRFAVIDTEAGRALHYADLFEFDHGELQPPFRPNAYAEAIAAADQAGYPVIVVDSASHEHAGDGGLLDWHEEELDRMAGDDWKKREAVKMAAWIRPKMEHRKMVSRLLQVRAHLILCFRAQEAIEIVKEGGKTVVRPKQSLTGLGGWIPVSEKNLPYELTLSFLLTADAPGLPKPIKLQEQHREFFPLDVPVSEETGVALAAWAAGGEERDPEADALGAELAGKLEALGQGEHVSRIERSRRENGREKHLVWLRDQLERANGALAAVAEGAVSGSGEAPGTAGGAACDGAAPALPDAGGSAGRADPSAQQDRLLELAAQDVSGVRERGE